MFPYASKNFNAIIFKTFGRLPSDEERSKTLEKSHLLTENTISTQMYVIALDEMLKVDELPTIEQFEDITVEVTNPPLPEMVELVGKVCKSGIKVWLLSVMYVRSGMHQTLGH